jgi:protein phosphatase
MVRTHNEDSVFVDADAGLAVLADGMGGYSAGEVASGIAVNVISSGMLQELTSGRELSKVDIASGLTHAALLLQQQIALANKGIYEAAQARPECAGMGTTLVATVFFQNRVSIGHIGDSRCYRLRADKFEQLTHDHSLLQEQIDSGMRPPSRPGTRSTRTWSRARSASKRWSRRTSRIPSRGRGHLRALLGRAHRHGGRGSRARDRGRQAQRPRGSGCRVDRCRQPDGGRDNISVILLRVPAEFLPTSGWFAALDGEKARVNGRNPGR